MSAIVLAMCLMGGDYTVSRGVRIDSERPIGRLILEMATGVIHGRTGNGITPAGALVAAREAEIETRLSIDGSSVRRAGTGQRSAPRELARAAWRLIGFVLWDADGRVERVTTATVRGHAVRITDAVSNGRVVATCVIGPPLGDKRVRRAVLTLTAQENERDLPDPLPGWCRAFLSVVSAAEGGNEHGSAAAGLAAAGGRVHGVTTWFGVGERVLEAVCGGGAAGSGGGTRITLTCSAVIDLPGDHCGLVRRFAQRIAQREAGPELAARVASLESVGRHAVLSGRGRLTDSVIAEFLERVCK